MVKRYIWLVVATVFFTFQAFVGSVTAAELDAATLTVPLNAQGENVTLSVKQAAVGRKLFQNTCSQCHAGGITKTDPNVGLDPEALSLATPPRNNVEALVEFMKDPKTYDGATSIAEIHPSIKSKDTFTEMKNFNEDDLFSVAGHILIQPKVVGDQWGGGKIYF